MKRGIYLVANKRSQDMCENLLYSIRASGCTLPVRLIHFGGEAVSSSYILSQVEFLRYEHFPDEAKTFIANMRSVLTDCPLGFLYRFLGWFSDWDEFIYADNDIVALCNWEILFEHLTNFDLVHADEEYITKGAFNYDRPDLLQAMFGDSVLESAITAGHIAVKRNAKMVDDINEAVAWFKKYPHIPKKHDQSLLHVAAILGKWNNLNLCKPPHYWLSSWAGDYKNSLQLIQAIQNNGSKISHLHYSGSTPKGNLAIQDLLFSVDSDNARLRKITFVGSKFLSGYLSGQESFNNQYAKVKRYFKRRMK
ncbi:hypothetical protein [Hymenobacter arizonensis]|uniref:Mannosyltransferase putative n=1 Tax=Hymenobacter arizonensis TaxID=1227077 RepID=A0A1I6BRK3_HYMAR|nr:hypothetical protein [Hymenobacter arizonensis]SFQ83588.1 Mannosyltransferase putative [Hymenobacter arizonensis]